MRRLRRGWRGGGIDWRNSNMVLGPLSIEYCTIFFLHVLELISNMSIEDQNLFPNNVYQRSLPK